MCVSRVYMYFVSLLHHMIETGANGGPIETSIERVLLLHVRMMMMMMMMMMQEAAVEELWPLMT